MMQRRSFLGAMLAAMVAPAVVKASSLMPIHADRFKESDGGLLVPKELSDMEIGRFESMRVIEESLVGPRLDIFTAAGVLLATIPMGAPQVQEMDFGRLKEMRLEGGTGVVLATGTAERFELKGTPMDVSGVVGRNGLSLSSANLLAGSDLTMIQFGVTREAW